MPDQPRPVWIDSLGADTLRYYAARAESSADQAFLYRLADAWDAAPADPTGHLAHSIYQWFWEMNRDEGDQVDLALFLLRALGMPDA